MFVFSREVIFCVFLLNHSPFFFHLFQKSVGPPVEIIVSWDSNQPKKWECTHEECPECISRSRDDEARQRREFVLKDVFIQTGDGGNVHVSSNFTQRQTRSSNKMNRANMLPVNISSFNTVNDLKMAILQVFVVCCLLLFFLAL